MKKKAAKIAGNTCALVDPKDMVQHIPELVSELKKSLIDPNPEVRSLSARALASLLDGAGEEHFEDLIPWLTEKMQGEGSAKASKRAITAYEFSRVSQRARR